MMNLLIITDPVHTFYWNHFIKIYINILDYNIAIKLDVKYGDAYVNRGSAKQLLNDYRGAILDFSKAIELDPNSTTAYLNRGLSKISLKEINGGCLDFSKAGELGYIKAYEIIQKFCNQ